MRPSHNTIAWIAVAWLVAALVSEIRGREHAAIIGIGFACYFIAYATYRRIGESRR
jgi:EamA domain-containing membrane protein RarD